MVAWDMIQQMLKGSLGSEQAAVDILHGTVTAGWHVELNITNYDLVKTHKVSIENF